MFAIELWEQLILLLLLLGAVALVAVDYDER